MWIKGTTVADREVEVRWRFVSFEDGGALARVEVRLVGGDAWHEIARRGFDPAEATRRLAWVRAVVALYALRTRAPAPPLPGSRYR